MKLHFDERLVRSITGVQTLQAAVHLLEQCRQFLQAALQIRQILIVGVLHAQRLAAAVHLHGTFVDAVGQAPQALTETAELAHQRQLVPVPQIQTGANSQARQLVSGDLADAMQLVHRQLCDEIIDLIRGNHEQPVGFAPVAGDLGQELVRRDASRHGDVQLLRHTTANFLGDARGAAGKMRRVTDIQIRLVQRQRLDQVGELTKDAVNVTRDRAVHLEARFDDQKIRAQLQRMPRRHRRTHTIGTRLVVAGGDYPATVRRTTDGQRTTGQTRVVTHLDGGVEAVAVDVDYLAHNTLVSLVQPGLELGSLTVV